MAGDGTDRAGEHDPSLAPPTPWDLDVRLVDDVPFDPTPPPAADLKVAVYGREWMMTASFATALFLFAIAVDLAPKAAGVAVVALGVVAVGVGLRIWSTPFLVVEAGVCTASNYAPPKRRLSIDGFGDLHLDGPRLLRRSDGLLVCTLRPGLVRPADVWKLQMAIAGGRPPTPVHPAPSS